MPIYLLFVHLVNFSLIYCFSILHFFFPFGGVNKLLLYLMYYEIVVLHIVDLFIYLLLHMKLLFICSDL